MSRITRSLAARAAVTVTVLAAAAGLAAAPALAHETPAPGSTCKLSGTTLVDHGEVFVCVSRTEGAKPRWGAGMAISRSPITLTDGWVKAAPSGMTAGFGMLKNPSTKAITVVGAFSSNAKAIQLHEVVDKDGAMVMQQKAGGFTIPAGGMVELKPGGNHLMLAGLTKPIAAGDQVPVTLITSTGGVMKVKLLGKVYNGANESYTGGTSGM